MLSLNKNKRTLYYSLLDKEVPVYETDDYGNVVTIEIDGVDVPVETGEVRLEYTDPVQFEGNITTGGGEITNAEYGVDKSEYNAVLITDKGLLPMTETSIIWFGSEPMYDSLGNLDPNSADYQVVKKGDALSSDRYVLNKVVK